MPATVKALEDLGRVRLSRSFFLRDFLYSDIAVIHGLSNVPDDPDLAIAAGTKLCEVNAFGNDHGFNCARNEANYAGLIWDRRDANGHMGATACIVVPAFWDALQAEGDWQKLAWWIHDHLPYSSLYFFPKLWAVKISWHEAPERRIDSYTAPKGCLTKPGMANHEGSHEHEWLGIEKVMVK